MFEKRLAMLKKLKEKKFIRQDGRPGITNMALARMTKKHDSEISKWIRSRGFAPTHKDSTRNDGVQYRGATNYIHGIFAEELDNVPLRRRVEKTVAMDDKLKGRFIRMFGNAREKFGRNNVATWGAEKFMKAIEGKEREKQEILLDLMEDMVENGYKYNFFDTFKEGLQRGERLKTERANSRLVKRGGKK